MRRWLRLFGVAKGFRLFRSREERLGREGRIFLERWLVIYKRLGRESLRLSWGVRVVFYFILVFGLRELFVLFIYRVLVFWGL